VSGAHHGGRAGWQAARPPTAIFCSKRHVGNGARCAPRNRWGGGVAARLSFWWDFFFPTIFLSNRQLYGGRLRLTTVRQPKQEMGPPGRAMEIDGDPAGELLGQAGRRTGHIRRCRVEADCERILTAAPAGPEKRARHG